MPKLRLSRSRFIVPPKFLSGGIVTCGLRRAVMQRGRPNLSARTACRPSSLPGQDPPLKLSAAVENSLGAQNRLNHQTPCFLEDFDKHLPRELTRVRVLVRRM